MGGQGINILRLGLHQEMNKAEALAMQGYRQWVEHILLKLHVQQSYMEEDLFTKW